MQRPTHRPLGVTLATLVLIVLALLAFVAAGAWRLPGPAGPTVSMVVGVVLGLVALVLAYGLWTLRSWAWLPTVMVSGLGTLYAFFAVLAAPTSVVAWLVLILIIALAVLVCLPESRVALAEQRSAA